MEGKFTIERIRNGEVIDVHVCTNPISTVGENHIIDVDPSPFGGPENPFVMKGQTIPIFQHEPPRIFTVSNGEREAVIDFSGDRVTYSGDLPVDEAAKLFFNAVFGHMQ